MQRSLMVLAALSIPVFPALGAQEPPTPEPRLRLPQAARVHGARLRIWSSAGTRTVGSLLAVSDTLLIVRRDVSMLYGVWGVFPREQVAFVPALTERVELSVNQRQRHTAMALGVVAGVAAGAALGAASVHSDCDESSSLGPCITREHGVVVGALGGAVVGYLVGRYVFGRDRWMQVWPAAP